MSHRLVFITHFALLFLSWVFVDLLQTTWSTQKVTMLSN